MNIVKIVIGLILLVAVIASPACHRSSQTIDPITSDDLVR